MTGLDAAKIRQSLMKHSAAYLDRIEVFSRIDSTNTYLKDQAAPPPGRFRIAIAEHQTAGRGRHDRQWISSPGGSLCLSLSYRFQQVPADLSALTLALGIGVADALSKIGVSWIQLKWPNDLLVGNAKLGGILTETLIRGDSDVMVIAGICLNIELDSTLLKADLPEWASSTTCLTSIMLDPPSREYLSEIVIEALMLACRTFAMSGFRSFAGQFPAYDWLVGRTIAVETPEGLVKGTAAGITDDGALLIDTDTGTRRIHAGSVKQVGERDSGQ